MSGNPCDHKNRDKTMEDTLTAHTRKENMKVKDLLEIQEIVEKRKTPCDMNGDLNKHYSKSKDEEMDILDMHLIHLVRSYSKLLNTINEIKETI